MRIRRTSRTLAAAALALLALTATAAADGDSYQIHKTAAGQAAAVAVTLTKADFSANTGWTGGATKPDLSNDPPCANFNPKRSDLVITGVASAVFNHAGLQFESDSQVLKTEKMVALDWQRTLIAPHFLDCSRVVVRKALPKTSRLVSFERRAVPKLSTYTAAFRLVLEVKTDTGKSQVALDFVSFGRGKTEITLVTTAPLAASSAVWPAELVLARKLAARIRV